MVPKRGQETREAFHEPVECPPGFGLRRCPGAFGSGACQGKRQRTAAVQDAVARCHRSGRVHSPKACEKTNGSARPESHESYLASAFGPCSSRNAIRSLKSGGAMTSPK